MLEMETVDSPPAAPLVDKSGERVRAMFGEIAARYDAMNHLLSAGVDKYWRWRTVRLAPVKGDAPILDLCTGTGDLALAYQRVAKGQAQVIGADFCHPMLVIGRKKGEAVAGTLPRFVEADAQRLPFDDDSFQIVSVAFGLRNVADTDQGLREMTRVCRPGGKVVVLEFSMPTRQPMRAAYSWYFRHVLPRIGQFFARNDREAYNYLPASVSEFPMGEALASKMRTAGLSDVKFHPLTFGVATIYIGVK